MNIKMLGNFRHCMLAREIRQRDGFIAPLINMPDPGIAAVEILGVYAIELAHALREVGFGGFDQQVIVVVHLAPSVAYPVKALTDLCKDFQPSEPICIGQIEILPPIALSGNVVQTTR